MRLFLSVDLVGSTAFKANKEYLNPDSGSPSPRWVSEFRAFYKNFPVELSEAYSKVIAAFGEEYVGEFSVAPQIWKTIGDEVVFCTRVKSIDHTSICVSAFLKALERYARILEEERKPLRLKGAGWLAAFPAPNISIAVTNDHIGLDGDDSRMPSENEEDFEALADRLPSRFDFLGKGIDTGFRIAKHSSEDRFIASVQLGYVLARAASKRKFAHSFGYHGREVLKGVIGDLPYPVISVDTERSEAKLKLRSREASLTGETFIRPHLLSDFLETFMEVHGVDRPCLPEGLGDWHDEFPESYIQYRTAFDAQLDIDSENVKQVEDAPDPVGSSDDVLDASREFLGDFKPMVDASPDELSVTEAADAEGEVDPSPI